MKLFFFRWSKTTRSLWAVGVTRHTAVAQRSTDFSKSNTLVWCVQFLIFLRGTYPQINRQNGRDQEENAGDEAGEG